MRRFNPFYAGVQHTGGMPLPEDRTCSLAGSGLSGAAAARLFKLTGFAPGFLARLRAIRPALIHAHFEESGLAALPLARNLDLPLITTFHGYDATATAPTSGARGMIHQVYAHQRRRLQREGSLFVAVSEFIRQKLIARGYPADRTVTVPIGVDVDLFDEREQQPTASRVLFVGRMVEKKGVTYLLRAMAKVARLHPEAHLVLIGNGPLMPELIEEAAALDLRNVTFTGARDPESVRREMGLASMLVAPSVTAASGDSEGLPMVVCEAQAMGVPVVGTHHAGIPEIIRHGQNGLLVPERSVDQLARSISTLLSRPDLCRQMGLAARAHVCLNFNLRLQNARLEDLYAQAVRDHAELRASRCLRSTGSLFSLVGARAKIGVGP